MNAILWSDAETHLAHDLADHKVAFLGKCDLLMQIFADSDSLYKNYNYIKCTAIILMCVYLSEQQVSCG